MNRLRRDFEDTALRHMDDIHSAALRMTRDKAEAEDLVQDTYLRAYQFFDKFTVGTCMRAWLLKILRNTFINSLKKQARMPEHMCLDELSWSEEELVSSCDPEKDLLHRFFDDESRSAVNTMPEEFAM